MRKDRLRMGSTKPGVGLVANTNRPKHELDSAMHIAQQTTTRIQYEEVRPC